jgi:hypothetical protein
MLLWTRQNLDAVGDQPVPVVPPAEALAPMGGSPLSPIGKRDRRYPAVVEITCETFAPSVRIEALPDIHVSLGVVTVRAKALRIPAPLVYVAPSTPSVPAEEYADKLVARPQVRVRTHKTIARSLGVVGRVELYAPFVTMGAPARVSVLVPRAVRAPRVKMVGMVKRIAMGGR